GCLPGPIQHQGRVSPAVGEREQTIAVMDCQALIFNPKVAFALARGTRFGITLAASPPGIERSEEGLHGGIGGMSVKQGRRVPTHEMLRLEPELMLADHAPVGNDRAAV